MIVNAEAFRPITDKLDALNAALAADAECWRAINDSFNAWRPLNDDPSDNP